MMGKNHVAVNAAVLTASLVCAASQLSRGGEAFVAFMIPQSQPVSGAIGFLQTCGFLLTCFFCFWIGSLLPDIDSKDSMLGRYVHLPLKHRTWMHSIWPCVPLFFFSLRWVQVRWLFAGYLLHIAGDSLSAAGICFLYPFKKYKEYASGAFVCPGHRLKLYRTSDGSERRFVIGTVALAAVVCFFSKEGILSLVRWTFL